MADMTNGVFNNYITGFHFALVIVPNLADSASIAASVASAGLDSAFKEVSGLSKEIHLEEVVCGGENRFKYRLPGTVSFQNLVLKRGIVLNASPLTSWCQDTLDNGLSTSIVTKELLILLLDQNGVPQMAWQFVGAYPVKWSGGDLDSEKNAIFIETIELAYQYFELDDGILSVISAALSLL